MNIINRSFDNNINLAICIFPADTLRNKELEQRMMDYTRFYALRFRQISNKTPKSLEIFEAESIEMGLHNLADKFDHILFMAAGVRIYDMTILFDIEDAIEKNPNYFVAAHILDWKDKWYELHHQFVLVNTKKWLQAGSPSYGGWNEAVDNLPIVQRSEENFHDDYTPLWIKFTGEYSNQLHQKQGWNWINVSARYGFDIINWNSTIRSKRTYYYPESQSEQFLTALKTLKIDQSANVNQRTLINQLGSISTQIWLLNTETMDLELNGEKFDTIALPAAGFKFLNVFQNQSLNEQGQLIIYDYNEKSLDWIKNVYHSDKKIEELILSYPDRAYFKSLKTEIFGYHLKTGKEIFTNTFLESLSTTKEFYGGDSNFNDLLTIFRSYQNIKFYHVDIVNNPQDITNHFLGKTAINISNIFCTDFSNAYLGISKTTEMFEKFLNLCKTETLVLGQDSFCRHIKTRINQQ